MTHTIYNQAPVLDVKFDPHLLSIPTFGFSAEKLHKIAEFLKKRVNSGDFKKSPKTKERLENKHHQDLEETRP